MSMLENYTSIELGHSLSAFLTGFGEVGLASSMTNHRRGQIDRLQALDNIHLPLIQVSHSST